MFKRFKFQGFTMTVTLRNTSKCCQVIDCVFRTPAVAYCCECDRLLCRYHENEGSDTYWTWCPLHNPYRQRESNRSLNQLDGECCVCGVSPVALYSHHFERIEEYAKYCSTHKTIGMKAYEDWVALGPHPRGQLRRG